MRRFYSFFRISLLVLLLSDLGPHAQAGVFSTFESAVESTAAFHDACSKEQTIHALFALEGGADPYFTSDEITQPGILRAFEKEMFTVVAAILEKTKNEHSVSPRIGVVLTALIEAISKKDNFAHTCGWREMYSNHCQYKKLIRMIFDVEIGHDFKNYLSIAFRNGSPLLVELLFER